MPFNFANTAIDGVKVIEPVVFKDERGFFFENYKESEMNRKGIKFKFVQDNSSFSDANVLREIYKLFLSHQLYIFLCGMEIYSQEGTCHSYVK